MDYVDVSGTGGMTPVYISVGSDGYAAGGCAYAENVYAA